MSDDKIECTKSGDTYHFKKPKVIKNIFGNKKTTYSQENFTMIQLNQKINLLKKQLTELTNKKNMAKTLGKIPKNSL